MGQIITITSKRQFTLPVVAFKEMGFREGDKMVVNYDKEKITIRKATDLVAKLAGSVSVPSRYRHLSPDELIIQAKKKRFSKKM